MSETETANEGANASGESGPHQYETVRYEVPAPGVARVVMDRTDARNAQNLQMTYDLDAALQRAADDDSVNVIIVAGEDPHFSSGHDLRGDHGKEVEDFPVVGMWRGYQKPGVEGLISRESEIYLRMCRRWRDIPKPTIAAVQGKCIAGGLAVAWVCDLIFASEDSTFCDPVVDLGICGVEYFGHPWEVGVRKAKEMLFTGDPISAQDAYRLGMVNHVVPRADLQERALELAVKIAARPAFAVKMCKQAVNQSQDAQGQWQAMESAFSLHQLCHSHNVQVHKIPVNPAGLLPQKKKG
ncbi:MAG: enoyl-CoA hydratase [Myxococcota bacterium]|nr:enoyl-CoA hydratase [Myxococcota bacterium]